jgi:hypothetical protein
MASGSMSFCVIAEAAQSPAEKRLQQDRPTWDEMEIRAFRETFATWRFSALSGVRFW